MNDEDQRDREAILARRRRWIAMALAGVAATVVEGCRAQPCLRGIDGGTPDSGVDANTPDAPTGE